MLQLNGSAFSHPSNSYHLGQMLSSSQSTPLKSQLWEDMMLIIQKTMWSSFLLELKGLADTSITSRKSLSAIGISLYRSEKILLFLLFAFLRELMH